MYNPANARRPASSMQSPCEIQAKEKLASVIYEYLLLNGAQKTAETFKEEVLNNYSGASIQKPPDNGPGFLQNWWMIFWDLYCATPDRRDNSAEPSQDGKMYYEMFMQGGGYNPGMMGGMHGMFPGAGQMGMPGPDGMMGPGFAGRFPPGRGPPPGGMQSGFMFPGGPDPRAMGGPRMQPNAMRMPSTSFAPGPGMRPNAGPPQGMPGYRPPSFMDSPNTAFPPGAMMPNGMGSQAPMSMASPGMPPGGPDSHAYMMAGMPASSSAMTFGMGDTSVSVGNGSLPPSSMNENPALMMMNGEEMKQSPVSTPHGINGGTPAPGSAQSAHPPSSGTPSGVTNDDKPGSNSKPEDMDEISKIKQGLMDDFTPNKETPEQTGAGGGGFF